MIRLENKVSRKVKTYTPLLLGLGNKEKEQLKKVPRIAIDNLLGGKGTCADLSALLFRMCWCYEISKDIYTNETQQAIKEVLDVLESFFTRLTKDAKGVIFNTLTQHEITIVVSGLDAMDEMQDQVTRKQMLQPAYRARQYLKTLTCNDSNYIN